MDTDGNSIWLRHMGGSDIYKPELYKEVQHLRIQWFSFDLINYFIDRLDIKCSISSTNASQNLKRDNTSGISTVNGITILLVIQG